MSIVVLAFLLQGVGEIVCEITSQCTKLYRKSFMLVHCSSLFMAMPMHRLRSLSIMPCFTLMLTLTLCALCSLPAPAPAAQQTPTFHVSRERLELDSLERLIASDRAPGTLRVNRLLRAAELLTRYFMDTSPRAKDSARGHIAEAETLSGTLKDDRSTGEVLIRKYDFAAGNNLEGTTIQQQRALLEQATIIAGRTGNKRALAEAFFYRSRISREERDTGRARSEIQQALQFAQAAGSRYWIAASTHFMGLYQKTPAQTRIYLQQALALYQPLNCEWEMIRCLQDIASCYNRERNYQPYRENLTQALALAKSSDIGISRMPDILSSLAYLYIDHFNDNAQAVRLVEEAERYAQQFIDPNTLATIYGSSGNVYAKTNNAVHALQSYTRALNYREQDIENQRRSGSTEILTSAQRNMARLLRDVASLNFGLQQFELCRSNLYRALSIFRVIRDSSRLHNGLNVIGETYRTQGTFDSALVYYRQAIAVAERLPTHDDSVRCIRYYGNIGFVLCKQGHFDEGIRLVLRANEAKKKDLAAGLFNKGIMINGYLDTGELYADNGQFATALDYTRRAMNIMEESGARDNQLATAYRQLARAYKGLGQPAPALDYFQRYSALHDSLFSAQSAEQTALLQNGIETREREGVVKSLQAEAERQTLTRNSILGGSALLLVMLGVSVYGYRQRGKANTEILRQQAVLEDQSVEIEITNTALQEKNLIIEQDRALLARERERSERLLLSVLPAPIAERMKSGETRIAEHFSGVTVLFADIVGFTKLSSNVNPQQLVELLDGIFSALDALAHRHGLEKIKTIGDAYMVVSGVPVATDDHCERVAAFALSINAVLEAVHNAWVLEGKEMSANPVRMRVGMHTGEVIAGVIGTSKFSYDLWGDTVNTASRMESHGEAGKIHITQEVHDALNGAFAFEERGAIEVKGKGVMRTWFLSGTKD
jgi:class 3 adenylate cyclase